MKNKTRLLAAALACALVLTGCGPRRTEPEPYPEPASSESAKTVAYVPLDDRPDNVERVAYLAPCRRRTGTGPRWTDSL